MRSLSHKVDYGEALHGEYSIKVSKTAAVTITLLIKQRGEVSICEAS